MKFAEQSRFLKSALLGAAFSLFFSLTAFAMTARISFNDPTAEPGGDVTVSMHVVSTSGEPLGRANIMLSYDASLLEFTSGDNAEGGSGSIHVTGQPTEDASEWYYSLRFRALQAGAADLTISTAEIYDRDAKIADIDHQGSSHILIGAEAQASEAAAQAAASAPLSSLSISPGKLSPAFDPSVTSYTAQVGEEVTRIAVSAVPADSTQKVSVSGNDNLEMGANTINISIADQDGNALNSYVIEVTKKEGATPTESESAEAAVVTVDGTDYTVADTFDASLLPEGWTAESYSYGGKTVQAGKGPDEHLHLLYLLAEGGTGNLYFYDDSSDSWSPYVEVGTTAKTVTAVPLDAGIAVPEGLEESRLNLNGKSVAGWVGSSDQGENYCVFYGMNSDGEKNFYRFDLKEKTLQRYFGAETQAAGETGETGAASGAPEDLGEKYRRRGMELIAACAVAAAAVLAALWLAFHRGGGDGPAPGDGRDSADGRAAERRSEIDGGQEAAEDTAEADAEAPASDRDAEEEEEFEEISGEALGNSSGKTEGIPDDADAGQLPTEEKSRQEESVTKESASSKDREEEDFQEIDL